MKPYSESCDQNRAPILAVLTPLFAGCRDILEIGSGTGQHAVHFATAMAHLTWHTSDRTDYHAGIQAWLAEANLANARSPLALDVARDRWPEVKVDGVFSANTAHIMHWPEVEAMFAGVGRLLADGGRFALYGPFNYGGRYTSPGNASFDGWLKQRDPEMGVRDFEAVDALARRAGLSLLDDHPMPANNRILCWQRQAAG